MPGFCRIQGISRPREPEGLGKTVRLIELLIGNYGCEKEPEGGRNALKPQFDATTMAQALLLVSRIFRIRDLINVLSSGDMAS